MISNTFGYRAGNDGAKVEWVLL